jgi:YHS domain-containing protein
MSKTLTPLSVFSISNNPLKSLDPPWNYYNFVTPKRFVCVVCNQDWMEAHSIAAKHTLVFGGNVYVVTSSNCKELFNLTPLAYIKEAK